MSIVSIHNVDCEFDSNESLSGHSDESEIPLYSTQLVPYKNYATKTNHSVISLAEAVAHHTLRCEGVVDKELSLVLVSKACMREYNVQFRSKDSVTDVLSFPSFLVSSDKQVGVIDSKKTKSHDIHKIFEVCANIDSGFSRELRKYLGDVLICCEYVCLQAQEYGESFEREFARVIIHGVLHILGYTHLTYDMQQDSMLRKQEHILSSFVFSPTKQELQQH